MITTYICAFIAFAAPIVFAWKGGARWYWAIFAGMLGFLVYGLVAGGMMIKMELPRDLSNIIGLLSLAVIAWALDKGHIRTD